MPSIRRLNTWKIYLILTGLGIFFILLSNRSIRNYHVTIIRDSESEKSREKFLVNTQGCRIEAPNLAAVSRAFRSTVESIRCELGSQLPLTEANKTHVFVNSAAIHHYYNGTDTPNCHWQKLEWKTDDNYRTRLHDVRYLFQDSSRVTEEFIKVECLSGGRSVYRDYHHFIPRKPAVEARCSRQNSRSSKVDTKLSILILGLGSVSRLHFHRSMPKTAKTLGDLGAVELLGYNKVGDNTLPNLVPLLAGRSSDEFDRNFWNYANNCRNCPFIWRNFSAAGYRTVFAEDACKMPTLGPYSSYQSTDYHYRPHCPAIGGDTVDMYTKICVHIRKNFENLLDYSSKWAKEFSQDPYFAFVWESRLAHGFLDYMSLGDDVYERTIRDLYERQLMNNTLLIVVSDHGLQWGEYRRTDWGRIEDNLPLAFLVFPQWWRKTYPTAFANLRRNAASLTTPFDLHETIVDILGAEYVEESVLERMIALNGEYMLRRGVSLFLPVPERRTCELAQIPGHWCACHTVSNVSLSYNLLRLGAIYLIRQLNSMTRQYPQCIGFNLKRVIRGKVWTPSEEGGHLFPVMRYLLTIETAPEDTVFEALIKHHNGTDELEGPASQLNMFGHDSSCVDDYRLRSYCICVPIVEKTV